MALKFSRLTSQLEQSQDNTTVLSDSIPIAGDTLKASLKEKETCT